MPRHPHSCPQCKRVFALLLKAVAGEVMEQHNLGLSAHLESFRGCSQYDVLRRIHSELQDHRGFKTFVRKPRLSGVDYFLPKYRVAVEFDESQHFTVPRRLSLALYPSVLVLGFDRERWMKLCNDLKRQDASPPYRDEQRAWLDVIRDFSAVLLGNQPTVRVYAGDRTWCELEPQRPEVVQTFVHRYLPALEV